MFRFTIRELLILTVTAGLAVGWFLDHRQSNQQLAQHENAAKAWRHCAGTLEKMLTTDGWYLFRADGVIRARKYDDYTKTSFRGQMYEDVGIEPKLNSPEAAPTAWR